MGHIEVNKEKGFIHVLLNYPNCTNSLTDDMIDELVERVEELEKENQNIIILSGSGKGFCSGGTLSILKGERDSKRNLFDQLEKVIKQLYLMPKFIVSAIHGSCFGIGLSLALATDYVIAHKDAQFSMNFYRKNHVPIGGGKFWLKRRLGEQLSRQWIWKEREISGDEAFRVSLIDDVTSRPVIDEVYDHIRLNKWGSIEAMIAAKKLYHPYTARELEKELRKEREWDLKMEA